MILDVLPVGGKTLSIWCWHRQGTNSLCWDAHLQDTLGNYDDCCLTLQEAVVGSCLQHVSCYVQHARQLPVTMRAFQVYNRLLLRLLPARTLLSRLRGSCSHVRPSLRTCWLRRRWEGALCDAVCLLCTHLALVSAAPAGLCPPICSVP
jgi:hypothetical protein